jgi:hypothetical protein
MSDAFELFLSIMIKHNSVLKISSNADNQVEKFPLSDEEIRGIAEVIWRDRNESVRDQGVKEYAYKLIMTKQAASAD